MRAPDHVPSPDISLPDAPVLVASARDAVLLSSDGTIEALSHGDAALRVDAGLVPILCHRLATARRLGIDSFPALDVLELFAFVRPANFALSTPRGLAMAMKQPPPSTPAREALSLIEITRLLLTELAQTHSFAERRDMIDLAAAMERGGWSWGPWVLQALDHGRVKSSPADAAPSGHVSGFEVWRRLPEIAEHEPPPPPGQIGVSPIEATRRLAELLGKDAEVRAPQADYAAALSAAFQPPPALAAPTVILAEAGTGVGKTLGYIAPASLWAEKNDGTVWLSTFTRNLQHQLDSELDRLYPDPVEKSLRAVVRKGRENYLCLLNLEEAVRGLISLGPGGRVSDAVALGLITRWAGATRNGDLIGGDFPGWLVHLLGTRRSLSLADRRGECIHAACPHYNKCFIERTIRRAARTKLVVANHALTLISATRGEDGQLPTRIVFDEGHHLFDAADSAFSAALSGIEAAELRRWLLGAEGGRGRARGLKRRAEDLAAGNTAAEVALSNALDSARALPGDGWIKRLADDAPRGPTEVFLAHIRTQVYARVADRDGPYGLEAPTTDPVDGLLEAATALDLALARLEEPLTQLRTAIAARLTGSEAGEIDVATRIRIEAVVRGLSHRALAPIAAWRSMLKSLRSETPPEFVDWCAVDRIEGRDIDIGLYRHWRDPMQPFAQAIEAGVHGGVITSATLADRTGRVDEDWIAAEARTGTRHLARPALLVRVPSPFDYPRQTRVLIVKNIDGKDPGQMAAAYRALFEASHGGGLGLFTAISRLREVQARIAAPLEAANIPLYAQHVDGVDTATLIDIFRAEEDACLLGTDAVRDGVDVPGRSLRLVVFDRVPWPRPDILYKARAEVFPGGKAAYADMLTRLRLRQAFGRLIRRTTDRGVFVLLDSRLPSRLTTAFPEGVAISRLGLAEAVTAVREFFVHERAPHETSSIEDKT